MEASTWSRSVCWGAHENLQNETPINKGRKEIPAPIGAGIPTEFYDRDPDPPRRSPMNISIEIPIDRGEPFCLSLEYIAFPLLYEFLRSSLQSS